jgi:VWFA-related protein
MSGWRQGWMYVLCLSFFPAFARQNGATGAANRLITLDVVVANKSGKAISGLQQQDFTLLDNKQPQQIASFRAVESAAAADPPVEVVLLLDEVNTSFQNVSIERQQVEKFLGQNGGQLAQPVSLIFFSDSGATVGTTASRDGKTLITELKQSRSGLRTIGKSQGFYGAGDRVQLSLSTLEQLAAYEEPRPGRKLVVWISPGWPLLSGPRIELTTKQQEGFFNSIVRLSDLLRRSRITLYDVDPLGTADAGGLRTSYYEEFLKGVTAARNVQLGNLGLQVLASQSGGRVLNSNNDIAGEIAECIADANAYYILTFEGLPGDGPNDYHALKVEVDKHGLTARTRAGYYAQPEHARAPGS